MMVNIVVVFVIAVVVGAVVRLALRLRRTSSGNGGCPSPYGMLDIPTDQELRDALRQHPPSSN